ncbi:hypothetical protein [Oerskovia flava]|uniref:hypothetical protein n=1 Tax=Oerskovia flava TaxID=2986422 RepID=UPI00223EEBAA|nr:hypothetical protein [Oerskovia sp. JB1-3-2]
MSTNAPAPSPAPDGDAPTERVEPTETSGAPSVEIESAVDPATVRRAPRYRAFFWTGAIAGIVLGSVLAAVLLSNPQASGLLKPGVYFTVTVLGTTMVTVLLAGLWAVLADRRSLRRR